MTLELRIDNAFLREVPVDPRADNARRQVFGACASRVKPTPVRAPRVLATSREVLGLLGLDEAAAATPEFAAIFSGSRVMEGMDPWAACYGGHQFGRWAGQLGDGRAISLCEAVGADGQRWELQLKGAGPTPYSRTADGRAVLRSSVREFLCSEAMHHLGVPTTRALSLVATGEPVIRDMFYDGNPQAEPGAVVCRVAPTFLRFGSFEILAARQDVETLRRLVEHTLRWHYPALGPVSRESCLELVREVASRTALMVAHWMRVGFVHGVMNTDNMSILGLTLDYGPYGWLDGYDPTWTPNTTDAAEGRYRFGHQPGIAFWNVVRFAEALHPLIQDIPALEEAVEVFTSAFDRHHRDLTAQKLGLASLDDPAAQTLADEVLDLLPRAETDMTLFFTALTELPHGEAATTADEALLAGFVAAWYDAERARARIHHRLLPWLRAWDALALPAPERQARMRAANPRYVLRNYLAQQAIERAEAGDPSLIHETLEVLRRPYTAQPGREAFEARRPEWARHKAGCSALSCSS